MQSKGWVRSEVDSVLGRKTQDTQVFRAGLCYIGSQLEEITHTEGKSSQMSKCCLILEPGALLPTGVM